MRWLALHAAILAVGLGVMFRPTLGSGFARVQADPGDTLLNHYVLEHSWQWLTRADYCGTLWSPPFFHPQPLSLAYSENLLGTAPLYWLLRAACPATPAYQLWMMLVAALTYAGTAWALRRFGVGHLLAALGAYAFAFGLPRLTQLMHQQLLVQALAPLALVAAWRFLRRPTVPALAGLLAATYWQVLASVYLGWFTLLGLGVFAPAAVVLDRGTAQRQAAFVRQRWAAVVGLVAVWVGSMAALAAPYHEANRDFRRPYAEVREMLPRPRSWLASAPQGAWYNVLPKRCRESSSELWLFPGAVPLALAVAAAVGLARRRPWLGPADRRLATAALPTAAVLVLLSLRWGDWSAWRGVYRAVPGGPAIRAVGRVFTTVELFALAGALVVVDRRVRAGGRWGAVVAAALLVAGVAEQVPVGELPSFEVAPWEARVERLRQRLTPGVPAYVALPGDRPFWEGQLTAMWAGLKANVPVVNGYSGRYPTGYPDWARPMTDEELRRWLGTRSLVQVIRDDSPVGDAARACPDVSATRR